MKHLLIILSILLLSSPVVGQSGKPQTIIIPTGSLGDISEIRKKMLEKTLESELDDYFAIVPKELFEEAQEQAFEELEYDECTEDQCIKMIQELLQVENSFKLDLMYEEGDTQISITWNDQDQKRVEEDYCEGCKTKGLRLMIGGLVEKLVGEKPIVVRKKKGILFRDTPFSKFVEGGEKWFKTGDEKTQLKFEGDIVNGVPNGQGTLTHSDGYEYVGELKDGLRNGQGTFTSLKGFNYVGEWKDNFPNGQGTQTWSDGRINKGEWKDGKIWNGTQYDKDGNITKYVNGVEQK